MKYDDFLASIYDYCPYFRGRTLSAEIYAGKLRNSDRYILEMGTATGAITEKLASRGKCVDTVDISESMIAAASQRITRLHTPNCGQVRFFVSDVLDFDKKQKYDMVAVPDSVITVLDDRKKQKQLLKICYEALKNGGHLVMDVFNPEAISKSGEAYAAVTRFRDADGRVYIVRAIHSPGSKPNVHKCTYEYRLWPTNQQKEPDYVVELEYLCLTTRELEEIVKEAGFNNISIIKIFDGNINFLEAFRDDENS